MTILDDDITIFRLALETEDRTRSETAALKRAATRLTRKWNTDAHFGFGKPSLEQRRARGRIDLLAELDAEPKPIEYWPTEGSESGDTGDGAT